MKTDFEIVQVCKKTWTAINHQISFSKYFYFEKTCQCFAAFYSTFPEVKKHFSIFHLILKLDLSETIFRVQKVASKPSFSAFFFVSRLHRIKQFSLHLFSLFAPNFLVVRERRGKSFLSFLALLSCSSSLSLLAMPSKNTFVLSLSLTKTKAKK